MTDHLAAEPSTDPDAVFRNFQRHNLTRAAEHFELTITRAPSFGWRLRSVSAPAVGRHGPRWLRVVSEQPRWARGDSWSGNADANEITGIEKPQVLGVFEWSEGDWRNQRAELMTLVPGVPCSPTDVLRKDPELPKSWFTELWRTFAAVATTPTARTNADQARITERISTRFGTNVDTTVTQWVTVHGDLHWSNLMRPRLAMLDWELWGRGPAGADAATLLCYSLLVPDVAETVRKLFADVLDTPTGRVAQLYVISRLMKRIDGGDHPDLAAPLAAHVKTLLG